MDERDVRLQIADMLIAEAVGLDSVGNNPRAPIVAQMHRTRAAELIAEVEAEQQQ